MSDNTTITSTFPIPAIGVSGILFSDHDEVLLIKRGQPPAEGFWSLPGGRLETGETLEAACRREFLEETGLAVTVQNVVAVVERKLEGFHYIIIDFVVELINSEATAAIAQSDVVEARWVRLDEFSHYQIVDGLVDILLRARNSRLHNAGLYASGTFAGDFILPAE